MKFIILLVFVLSFTLFSCKKEEIHPNGTSILLDDSETDAKNGNNSNGIDESCDDDGTITDPNNDEDETKKIKQGK